MNKLKEMALVGTAVLSMSGAAAKTTARAMTKVEPKIETVVKSDCGCQEKVKNLYDALKEGKMPTQVELEGLKDCYAKHENTVYKNDHNFVVQGAPKTLDEYNRLDGKNPENDDFFETKFIDSDMKFGMESHFDNTDARWKMSAYANKNTGNVDYVIVDDVDPETLSLKKVVYDDSNHDGIVDNVSSYPIH